MRELKFRAWSPKLNAMLGWDTVRYMMAELLLVTNEVNIPMQYTGLNDKNGREIWEGDIVRDMYGKVWVVGWNQGYAAFGKREPLLGEKAMPISGLHPSVQLEVIGNIYENPELLETPA